MLSDFIKKLLFTREFFIIDGKVEILGEKQAIIPLSAFAEMQKDPKAYDIFKNIAKIQSDKNFTKVSRKDTSTMLQLFELFGVGKLEVFDLDQKQKKAIVRIEHNPFAETCMQTKVHPIGNCKITSALIAGVLSSFFEKDVNANEDNCMIEGKDYCEFIVK
jgi:predicted hydrocarbon binding protein